ncbi:testis-expressed protein 45 [Alligator mississippiensis]|uniref:testis-expressed protein 45 n=1 Tax=Alligator mississippiensis TaxID=8496 RepID=UPI002877782A|nr:testis-expressed protein 45 [Alligator mississippiensis]
MAAPVKNLVPAPSIMGADFQKASHFRTSFDRWPPGRVDQSVYKVDYPPYWGNFQRESIPLPLSKGVIHKDFFTPKETGTETQVAFSERPHQPKIKMIRPQMHALMHADPRISIITSTARDSYPGLEVAGRRPLTHKPQNEQWNRNLFCENERQFPRQPSLSCSSYVDHGMQPVARAPCVHLGGHSPITGDGRSHYQTTHHADFQGEWVPPVQPCEKMKSAVVLGSPRITGNNTEQHDAYTAPAAGSYSIYDKDQAVETIHKTTMRAGDDRRRFATTTAASFPPRELVPISREYESQLVSSFPRGDRDPKRSQERANTTTYRTYYTEFDQDKRPPRPAPPQWRGWSFVPFGDDKLSSAFYSTLYQEEFPPRPPARAVPCNSKDQLKSHLPLNQPAENLPISSTQAAFVPHSQPTVRPTEESLQRVRDSHLVPPLGEQRQFQPEQPEQYYNKYSGPAVLYGRDWLVSSVPLGTIPRTRTSDWGPKKQQRRSC